MRRTNRRTVLEAAASSVTLGVIGGVASGSENGPPFEVWAADQGTDTMYVYRPHRRGRGDAELREHDVLDLEGEGIDTPHMVWFSDDHEYALVANTGAKERDPASTAVIHAPSRHVVEVVETGAGSHFATFTPNEEYVIVDVIGESEIVRIDADLKGETFEIDARIAIDETVDGLTEEEGAPICHLYDHAGRSIHTLGPSYHDAGVVIVDHESFEVVEAFPGEELPANCGTMPHPTEEKFYLTAGLPSDPDADPEEDPLDAEGVGEYYVLDTSTDEVLADGESTRGVDAHGPWIVERDGDPELWIVNRETNDGVVVDADTDEVKEEIDAFGPADEPDPEDSDAPDILWSSPDDEYLFGTLRGPNPLSGDPHAATGVNSGFAVWDVDARERVDVIQPDDSEDSDFHGIGVRPVDRRD